MTAPRGFYGWRLLAALWTILFVNVAFPFFGASIINTWMAVEFDLDRRMLGLPFTVFILMTGLPGPLIAMSINHAGIRVTMITGGVLVCCGALCMALFVSNGIQAVLVFGLMVGLGTAAGGPIAAQTCAARWFIRRRALALSIVMSAPGFGGFAATRLVNSVITANDGNWRSGWWLIAGLACLSTLVAVLFIRETPAAMGQRPDGEATAVPGSDSAPAAHHPARVYKTHREWSFGEMLRCPVLWLFLLSGAGFSSCFMLFLAHGVIHLQDLGHSPAAAARSLSVLTAFTLVGNFLAGFLGDRIEPRYLLIGTVSLCAVAMLLVVRADTPMELYPYAICLGTGFGGSVLCLMTMVSNYFGSRVYASAVGLVMAVQTSASSTLPVLAGMVFDRSGSYSPVFHGLAALCCGCAALLLLARTPVHPADKAAAGAAA